MQPCVTNPFPFIFYLVRPCLAVNTKRIVKRFLFEVLLYCNKISMTKNFLTNEKKQSQVVALVCIVCVCVCASVSLGSTYARLIVFLCVLQTRAEYLKGRKHDSRFPFKVASSSLNKFLPFFLSLSFNVSLLCAAMAHSLRAWKSLLLDFFLKPWERHDVTRHNPQTPSIWIYTV